MRDNFKDSSRPSCRHIELNKFLLGVALPDSRNADINKTNAAHYVGIDFLNLY